MNIDEVPVCKSVFKMEGKYYLKASENTALPLGNREPIIILPSWPIESVRDWKGTVLGEVCK